MKNEPGENKIFITPKKEEKISTPHLERVKQKQEKHQRGWNIISEDFLIEQIDTTETAKKEKERKSKIETKLFEILEIMDYKVSSFEEKDVLSTKMSKLKIDKDDWTDEELSKWKKLTPLTEKQLLEYEKMKKEKISK